MNTINGVSYNQPAFQSGIVSGGKKITIIKIPIKQRELVQSERQSVFDRILNFFGLDKTGVLKIDISALNMRRKQPRLRLYSIEKMIDSANRALQKVINNK